MNDYMVVIDVSFLPQLFTFRPKNNTLKADISDYLDGLRLPKFGGI